ncbi:MAG: ribosome maturation factor RimM, partial [Proteobacteria bacterium]|nr:ribosome maturation factor RimM [Pseudomonadota bacterium]
MNTQENALTDVVVVGRIGGAFGVRGWVRVVSYTDPVENLLEYRPWLLDDGSGQWRPVEVREARPHQKGLVAALRDIVGRDQAQSLSGTTIGVPRSAFGEAAPGEYFWRDLVGLTV